ncbi:MAG: hypothetical protein CW691_05235 [Candidatus Bathyarchaeum sp.]|nr:MAG: hypothetical protein CW691_05235 [Candidatus Bathyarchaeum sp.]
MFSYINAIAAGLFSEFKDKRICRACQRELLDSKGIEYKGYLGTRRGSKRIRELTVELKPTANEHANVSPLPDEVNNGLFWQKDEKYVAHSRCTECFDDPMAMWGAKAGKTGYLVITNQRILFACTIGFRSKTSAIIFGINLEDVFSVSGGKIAFGDKLIILDKNNNYRNFMQGNIHSLIPVINSAISDRKVLIQSEKEKSRIHVLLDFSSIQDEMSKGGIIMTTYNCPKCNASLEIPESGKVLFCKYCNTAIKPVDIFDRIKSFL